MRSVPVSPEKDVAMRKRAFRPEVPGCLENRSLLSGLAGRPKHPPVVFSHQRLARAIGQVNDGFDVFTQHHDVSQLRFELNRASAVALVPFGRIDGLRVSYNRIINKMRHDIHARIPGSVEAARHEAVALTEATVEARIRAGDLIIT